MGVGRNQTGQKHLLCFNVPCPCEMLIVSIGAFLSDKGQLEPAYLNANVQDAKKMKSCSSGGESLRDKIKLLKGASLSWPCLSWAGKHSGLM